MNNCEPLRRRHALSILAAAGFLTLSIFGIAPAPAFAQDAGEDMAAADPHIDVLSQDSYPRASKCARCHRKIYEEWRSSSHAYSAISPVFHKFEQAINTLAPTINAFCVRCHIGAGTAMGEPREMVIWERSQVAREGVTCIVCHRIEEAFGKVNGERRIVPGDIYQPVFGPEGGPNLAKVIENSSAYKVATRAEERGISIHNKANKFAPIEDSEFCSGCHQVVVNLGIKLEVVWDQFRASPSFAAGETCQDCHMSPTPGVVSKPELAPVAVIGDEPIGADRPHHDHGFVGPGYPIAHPGLFPHNPEAEAWTPQEWLRFNHRAGWGEEDWEDEYEEAVDAGDRDEIEFPEIWEDRFDREDARVIIVNNIAKIEEKRELRRQVMENGSRIDGPFFTNPPAAGQTLAFRYRVTNLNPGHNMPSGSLGAQPEIWLNVVLVDPDGQRVWESGYVDSRGDMADQHSKDVLAGIVPHDDQLFNLQTKFLTTNVKGTDREMYLPVNFDIDQLPFLRPAAQPVSVMNHPPFVRMEGRSIPPLGSRDAKYRVPGALLTKRGTYRLSVRMRSRAEPIYFMEFIGATEEMIRSMNEWMLDIHPYSVEFEVN